MPKQDLQAIRQEYSDWLTQLERLAVEHLEAIRIMNLTEFLNKWASEEREYSKLRSALAGFFERDVRTVKNWEYSTPYYVRWILRRINTEWEEEGKRYSIFFEF